jgi:3-deoxy-D-manno-octulosonate 8-phosphate phosphatase (KDO 8-P phosphatase)
MKQLQQSGVPIAIITARQSALVSKRMQDLGIEHVFQGNRDKLSVFQTLIQTLNIAPEHICYVGDDLLDLPVMLRCGVAIAVADAHDQLLARADYITQRQGGQGAAREVCDMIITAQGNMPTIMAKYLSAADDHA